MKKLRKIILLFIFIFITGIFITVIIIRASLEKNNTEQTSVLKEDIGYLLKSNSF